MRPPDQEHRSVDAEESRSSVRAQDKISNRIRATGNRVRDARAERHYFYNQPIDELCGGARVRVGGREMLMLASYSYLGLIGHPKISAAAKAAIDQYGTGTHGVRLLAGSLDLHVRLERTIADFHSRDEAITFSSGYMTNLTAVSTLVGRRDVVICDKLDHASIVDGCHLSGAQLVRFRHNDMDDLERCLRQAPARATKLVVADAVFSMDGDIVDLPTTVELCRKHDAWLMIDEAHSLGMLGATGRGIEEHFDMVGSIDVKMGTLSKTIPSVGGYLAGRADLIELLRHTSRAYIFSAALSPAQAGAAQAAFEVLLEEPERAARLRRTMTRLKDGFDRLGLDTMTTQTAILPVFAGSEKRAFEMVRCLQDEGVFILPIIPPAVPEGLARLRTTVTAAHTDQDVDEALRAFEVMTRTLLRGGIPRSSQSSAAAAATPPSSTERRWVARAPEVRAARFLTRWGLRLEDLPALVAPVRGDGTLLLCGSIADGLANEDSDLDLLMLADAELGNEGLVLRAAQAENSTVRLPSGVDVNCEVCRPEALESIAAKLCPMLDGLRNPRGVGKLTIIEDPALRVLHRLRTGVPLVNPEATERWRRVLRVEELPGYMVVLSLANHFAHREDAIAQAKVGEAVSAAWMLKVAMDALAFAALAAIGETNFNAKWRVRLLDVHRDDLGAHVVEGLKSHLFVAPSEDARRAVAEATSFADEVIQVIVREQPEMVGALLEIRKRITFTTSLEEQAG